MYQSMITVVDAVMGTGKSKWISMKVKEDDKRAVIVLPRLSELERYEKQLNGVNGLVSLREGDSGKSKKERFSEALEDAQIILITHALFEEHLSTEMFKTVNEGEWSLIMDEVITSFEPMNIVTGTDIAGLLKKDVLIKTALHEKVNQLSVNTKTIDWYLKQPATQASKAQKELVKTALVKDLLTVECEDENNSFYTFTLRDERLNVFKDITILTYPFKETDLDYWFQIKKFDVLHLKLACKSRTGSLNDFELEPHDGMYSGRDFAHLIELIEPNGRGLEKPYGHEPNHFSATQCRKLLRNKDYQDKLNDVRGSLRTLFRNNKDSSRHIDASDFMFTCLSDCIPMWSNRAHKLSTIFIGKENWVPYNERGVNGHANKHNLAFLYNVYPFNDVERTVNAFRLEYNRDRYALYVLIQWVWRSAIRKEEKIRLYLPSRRMRQIFNEWQKRPPVLGPAYKL